jgi:hypothetical protein
MVSLREKAKMKKAGNLNQGRSYVITTLRKIIKPTFYCQNNILLIDIILISEFQSSAQVVDREKSAFV